MFLNGAISDGMTALGQVHYARGIFHNTVNNSYTGITQLGANSPNNASTNILYSDGVFSTGRVVFGGGTAIKTVQGAAGLGTRTLANDIQLSRDARFAGTESFVLTGKVFQSNTRSIINDLTGPATLSLQGQIFTDSGTLATDLGRRLTFAGTGLVQVSGVIDDKDGNPAANRGIARQAGPGRTVFLNNSVVAYGNATEVVDGTLQLGTGTAPVNLNGHVLAGNVIGSATTGTLEINHTGSMAFDTSTSYNVNINHVAAGTTSLTDHSFGSGSINVTEGTVLVNAGAFAGSTDVGTRDPLVTGNTAIMGVASTAGLHVGQQVTGVPVAGTATFPAGAYVAEIIDGTTILLSANVPTVTGGTNTWNLNFNAGTGTGTANVIAGPSGTVGGTGLIGGFLGVNGTVAPGTSIGTLSVAGNATINGSFDVEYDGSGSGSIDLLAVGGLLTLGANSIVDFSQFGAPADDPAYVFATYSTLSGTFGNALNVPSGYMIDYVYNGNSIALVPEPAGILSVVVGAALLLAGRRKSA
jgi:hypothetical protein